MKGGKEGTLCSAEKKRKEGRTDGRIHGKTERMIWKDGRKDGWKDGNLDLCIKGVLVIFFGTDGGHFNFIVHRRIFCSLGRKEGRKKARKYIARK